MLKCDANVIKLNNTLSSFDLKYVIREPTRVTQNSQTCIDNIIINRIVTLTVKQSEPVSDHNILISNIQSKHCRSKLYKTIRPMSTEKINLFKYLMGRTKWDHLYSMQNINDAYKEFQQIFLHYYDICFPQKIINTNERLKTNCTWITPSIKSSARYKRKLFENIVWTKKRYI